VKYAHTWLPGRKYLLLSVLLMFAILMAEARRQVLEPFAALPSAFVNISRLALVLRITMRFQGGLLLGCVFAAGDGADPGPKLFMNALFMAHHVGLPVP